MQQGRFALQVEIDSAEFEQYFRAAIRRGKDLKPPLKMSGVHMVRSFALNFIEQGRPKPWKPLEPTTVAGRRGGSSKILQDTGRLKMSALTKVSPGNIYELKEDSLKMGSDLETAGIHQWGTDPYDIFPRNKKILKIPTPKGPIFRSRVYHPGIDARPFILIQDEDVKVIVDIFKKYAVGK